MSVCRVIWMNLVILAGFNLQVDAIFAQVFNGVRQQSVAGRSDQSPNYFTILGHVARPGTYELPTSSPSLTSFIQYAGNLTAPASGQIRIVRNGRIAQSTFYSDKSTLRLAPGDIVVVDGKVNQGRVIVPGESTPSSADTIGLAITGLRDYPILLSIPAEQATIRWITRHVGLDQSVIPSVKSVTARHSDRVLPDTRLTTGTVLAFPTTLVDPSRLSEDLPVPVKAGRPVAPVARRPLPIAPLSQQPVAGDLSNFNGKQQGAAPGRALVPTIQPRPQTPDIESNLPRAEQAFVKELLTDPASVQLDEQTPASEGRAFVSRPSADSQQFATATDGIPSGNAIPPTPSEPGTARLTDETARAETQAGNDRATSRHSTASTQAETADVTVVASPEAPRPYQSTPSIPEPLQPLGSSRQTTDTTSEFSFAEQAAGRNEPTDSSTPPVQDQGSSEGARPTQKHSNHELTPAPTFTPTLASTAKLATIEPAVQTQTVSETSRSQLLPPPPVEVNVPVVSVITVGILGAIAASFLIYSIVNEKPVPRLTQIDTSGRYWLDRMIENDIPIVDETVDYPHNTQLFGKPAPIQRVDAAHKSIPRPHFSAPGGKSGVLKANPAMPDAPAPDTSDEDQKRIVKVHSGRPSQQSARAVPEPHTPTSVPEPQHAPFAEPGDIETAVFGDTGSGGKRDQNVAQSSSKPERSFRLDTGHKTVTASSREATTATDSTRRESGSTTAPNLLKKSEHSSGRVRSTRQTVSVQPSQVVVQGSNLLDRILTTVDSARHSDVRNSDEHQTDERGNS